MWAGPVGVCTPVGVVDVATPKGMRWSCPRTILVMASQPLWPFTGHEVLRGLFTCVQPDRPSLVRLRIEAGRGPEHCPQSFAPPITRQHVWVGTPGHRRARSGSWSPSSILLHRPCEVSQEYACSPSGHNPIPGGALRIAYAP